MKLYVGNIAFRATEADLEGWFNQAGVSVDSVSFVRDRFSGEVRGFGFVEINDDQEATRAISACNGKQFMGRTLIVNEARPMTQQRESRPDRGGHGGDRFEGRPRGRG